MVLWYHLILTAYGFWLPNDPRGSWSDFVGSWDLYKFGPATTVNDKRSYAHDPHDVSARRAAKKSLLYPPVRFTEAQREAIAEGFRISVENADYVLHALCIGHDHAHAIVQRHERTIEQIARHLKSKATMEPTRRGIHPLMECRKNNGAIPTPWSVGEWSVFIENAAQLQTAIAYVERHPVKEGLTQQSYSFLVSPRV